MRRFWILLAATLLKAGPPHSKATPPQFQTSDRCQACHNGMTTRDGTDASIGFHWRASIMANSSRDPYWQASVRREVMDHPESQAHIEDECSICHMPITRYEAKIKEKAGEIFSHLPLSSDPEERKSADGVSCSVCHQITEEGLRTPKSYNGGFVIHGSDEQGRHPEYGPFDIDAGVQTVMRSSSDGYRPAHGDHIRDSGVCGTCHTLITSTLGREGRPIGALHEQMPYPEWLHSDYRDKRSCQSCHMPEVPGPVQISKVLGVERDGARLHSFVGSNFLMLEMLNRFRGDLDVQALPEELGASAQATRQFLKAEAATIEIRNAAYRDGEFSAVIHIHNRDGHKLPTAYPARRVWIHLQVRTEDGHLIFESGALRPDGSIEGNRNDVDGSQFEPHHREIHSHDQVQIYESILGDAQDHVTTGLLAGTHYLKDNRLLPDGFDKKSAPEEIRVVGDANGDDDFRGGGDDIRYAVTLARMSGPLTIFAELLYQPIGFRWAHNFDRYQQAAEARNFVNYYSDLQDKNAIVLAQSEAVAGR